MKGYLENVHYSVDTMAAVGKAIDLSKYDLIIIGSGIYGGAPHKSIPDLINSNRPALSSKKIAVFAVCGTMAAQSEKKRKKAQVYVDKVAGRLNPISKTVFAGRIPSYGWFGNIMIRMLLGAGPGDHRDWNAIKTWTLSLAAFLD